ncbi:divergent polysaccharide deacetylase family protein [Alginatibacterium sediminis]|uniref:Divergent polysaccharide deacetylase family protein n=1 Tax=Alginatibacterium sediminis TaxID=2164068 RepID=A0A420ELD7_9ALTE|nr:divergent polysaccharide deacetylase family protein [Alginatibacterium sediminis]RKF21489.1 divergent polysaccharide deacetylase family protein [Alginatibacterium sediminis]
MVKTLIFLTSLVLAPFSFAAQLNIIIDDLGHSNSDFEWLGLPTEITFSILPGRHYSQALAQAAYEQERDIMLHMPMQALDGSALGEHGLEQHHNEIQIKSNLLEALQGLPQAVGINNHKGSLLTGDAQAMLWVMQVLKQQQLFFVDSRTHIATVAQQQAIDSNIPNLRRHIFLDHVDSLPMIKQQLQRAIAAAQRNGHVVAIGHPRSNTLLALQQMQLPVSVELVSTQQLLAQLSIDNGSDQTERGETIDDSSKLALVLPIHNNSETVID